jgi:hypothetical protein
LLLADAAKRINAEMRSWLTSLGVSLPPAKPLDPHGATSIYGTGTRPPGGYPDPGQLEWRRVLTSSGAPAPLWIDGATSTDPVQGQLGDCWLISAMSLIATRDGVLPLPHTHSHSHALVGMYSLPPSKDISRVRSRCLSRAINLCCAVLVAPCANVAPQLNAHA